MTPYQLIRRFLFCRQAAGKYRQQGRNYVVEDGDIIFFKFNAGAGLKDAKKKWWHAFLMLLLVHLYINMILLSWCTHQPRVNQTDSLPDPPWVLSHLWSIAESLDGHTIATIIFVLILSPSIVLSRLYLHGVSRRNNSMFFLLEVTARKGRRNFEIARDTASLLASKVFCGRRSAAAFSQLSLCT